MTGVADADCELLLSEITNLKAEREAVVRKLEMAQFTLEDNTKRAIQGENLYHDAEIELWKSSSDIVTLQREIVELSRHRDAIVEQIASMKLGGGVSLWPRPVLHPHMLEDSISSGQLEVQPCSYCNRYFTANDIVIASCMHFYHPFCIAKVCAIKNRCVTCGEIFHPGWWRSFGFRDLDAELEEKAIMLDLTKAKADLKQSLQEDSGLQIHNCKSNDYLLSFLVRFFLLGK